MSKPAVITRKAANRSKEIALPTSVGNVVVGGVIEPGQGQIAADVRPPDFEFCFGAGKHLRGRGWLGIVALGILAISGVVILTQLGPGIAGWGARLLRL